MCSYTVTLRGVTDGPRDKLKGNFQNTQNKRRRERENRGTKPQRNKQKKKIKWGSPEPNHSVITHLPKPLECITSSDPDVNMDRG